MFSDHPLKGGKDIAHPLERHPDPTYETFLDRHHPLFADQVGHVEEVVPPDVDGAGNHEEEHVVLAFDHLHQETGQLAEPEKRRGRVHRTVSFTQKQMDDWFEPLNTNFFSADEQSRWRDNRPWIPQLSAEPAGAIEKAMQSGAETPEEA
jgi:hypothetical protein